MSSKFQLREFTPSDAQPCFDLFLDTIRSVNCRDYNPKQIAAWASDQIDQTAWMKRFDGKVAYVAEQSGELAGFADMTREGFLDRLFVSAKSQRQGIATGLLDAIATRATDLQLSTITTEASITARPFFLARQFVELREQSIMCRGEMLTNFVMLRQLVPDLGSTPELD